MSSHQAQSDHHRHGSKDWERAAVTPTPLGMVRHKRARPRSMRPTPPWPAVSHAGSGQCRGCCPLPASLARHARRREENLGDYQFAAPTAPQCAGLLRVLARTLRSEYWRTATGKLPGNVAMVWSKFFSISVLEARQVQCQLILIESSTTKGETARPTAERLAVALPPPGLSATAASKAMPPTMQ